MTEFDTITAISTPLGEAGLAIVRVSGPQAVGVADRVFRPVGRHAQKPSEAASHTIHYGHILLDGKVVDEVQLGVLRAPRTFTREDMVEITCHGGMLPTRLVLDATLAAGARLAQPGEFTKRAFLNGRIDLAQAEAVADLIHARTELALTAAHEQLAGKLSRRIEELRTDLMKLLAHVEAHIDFPDEDISPDTREQMLGRLDAATTFMNQLLRTANEGMLLRRGVRAAIVGRPNAGKSSLLNQLLGHERAIVSPIPGTTRDTIQETANIRGIPVVFIDTAGLRDAGDQIEQEGIRRTWETLDRAELVLHVFDRSQPLTDEDRQTLERASKKPCIAVLNKADLSPALQLPGDGPWETVEVSCANGEGIEQLKDTIRGLLWSGQAGGEMLEVMINARHQDALHRARASVALTRQALAEGASIELAALDLRLAVQAVGEIVGKTTNEDLLDSIFSQFCLGK